jgi:hypothetical protein
MTLFKCFTCAAIVSLVSIGSSAARNELLGQPTRKPIDDGKVVKWTAFQCPNVSVCEVEVRVRVTPPNLCAVEVVDFVDLHPEQPKQQIQWTLKNLSSANYEVAFDGSGIEETEGSGDLKNENETRNDRRRFSKDKRSRPFLTYDIVLGFRRLPLQSPSDPLLKCKERKGPAIVNRG